MKKGRKAIPIIMLSKTDSTVTSLNNLTDDITILSNANIQVTTEGQAIKIDSSQVSANKADIAKNTANNTANKADIAKNTAKVGIPTGGTTGQSLVKKTDTDGDVEWKNDSGVGARLPVGVLVPFYYDITDTTMRLLGIEPCNGASIVTNKDDIYFSLWGAIKTTYGGRGDIGGGDFEFKVPPDNVEGVFHRSMGGNAGAFGEKQDDLVKGHSHNLPSNAWFGANNNKQGSAGSTDVGSKSHNTVPIGTGTNIGAENRPINRVVKVGIVYIKSSQPLPAPPEMWSVNNILAVHNNVDLNNDPVILDMIEENGSRLSEVSSNEPLTTNATQPNWIEATEDFILTLAEYISGQSGWGTGIMIENTPNTYNNMKVYTYSGATHPNGSSVETFIAKGKRYALFCSQTRESHNVNSYHLKLTTAVSKNELTGKTVHVLDDNNILVATVVVGDDWKPTHYTIIPTLPEIEGKCQVVVGDKWVYKNDPYPEHRDYCKWISTGYKLDASKKDNLISVISDKVKSQTENNISIGLWLDEGEEVEFTSTYEHLRFTNISDAKSFIKLLKNKTMEELIDLLKTKEIVI